MKRFWIYGFIGCLMEVVWTGVAGLFSGDNALASKTSIWMITIYGLAVFLEPIQDNLKKKKINWFIRGVIYMLCIFTAEYITGYLLSKINIYVWNYTDKFNINGYITLTFVPVWFVVGLLFERIREFLDEEEYLNSGSSKVR